MKIWSGHTIPFNRLLVFLAGLIAGSIQVPFGATIQSGICDPSSSGNPSVSQLPGASCLRSKSIDYSYYRGGTGAGTVVHNVNVLTGQPVYHVPIGSISANGEVSFPIGFTYAGPVRQLYDADNERGPTSWIGFGWNFNAPFVSVNHKGTLTIDDDVFFCDLGPYGGGQILKSGSGKYFISTDPSIAVTPQLDAEGLITSWQFQTSNGVKLYFGKNGTDFNAARTVLRSGNTIAASPYTISIAKDYIYRWDVYKISDNSGTNSLAFRYDKPAVYFGTRLFTRESYLHDIIWSDRLGNEIERFTFTTGNKGTNEYFSGSEEPEMDQKLFETRSLIRIDRIRESLIQQSWTLNKALKSDLTPAFPYPKRRLMNIAVSFPNPRGGTYTDPKMGWNFTYDDSPNRHSGLKTITKPFFGIDEYEYGRPNYSASGDWSYYTKQDPTVYTLKDPNGVDVSPVASEIKTYWETQSSCSERFCVITASNHKTWDWIYINVFMNNGNYFKPATLGPAKTVFQKSYNERGGVNTVKVIPWNDNFLIVDYYAKSITLYEWDGNTFQEITNIIKRASADGTTRSVLTGNGDPSTYNVTLGGDYILVKDFSVTNPCGSDYAAPATNVYIVKKINGVWKDINERECVDPSTCVNNVQAGVNYGEAYKTSKTACMAFDHDLFMSAGSDMFHLVDKTDGIIFSYIKTPSGQSFNLISDKYIAPSGGVQMSSSPMNWINPIIEPIKIQKDYFLVKSKNGTNSRFDIMHYDGVNIRQVGFVGPTTDNIDPLYGATLNAWTTSNYFLITDQIAGTVQALFKYVSKPSGTPTGLGFGAFTVRSDLPLAAAGDFVAKAYPNGFALDYYPDNTVIDGVPTNAPLVASDNYRSYLYLVDASLGSTYYQYYDPLGRFQDANHRNYFDLTLSPENNLITAKACHSDLNAACVPGPSSAILDLVTANYLPGPAGLSNKFIRSAATLWSPFSARVPLNYNYNQNSISNASRIGAQSIINTGSGKIEFALMNFQGTGFTQYPFQIKEANGDYSGDLNFVTKFRTKSDIQNAPVSGKWTEFNFFDPQILKPPLIDKSSPEFNVAQQSFVFSEMTVSSYIGSASSSLKELGAETFYHVVDFPDAMLSESQLNGIGYLKMQRTHDLNSAGVVSLGREFGNVAYDYLPENKPDWPVNLYLMRLASSTNTRYAPNGTKNSQTEYFYSYDPDNNSPLFTKTQVGNKFFVSQNLYKTGAGENKSAPFASYQFKFSFEPSETVFETCPSPDLLYYLNGASSHAISATEQQFDPAFPYKTKAVKVWRDDDPTLTDTDLKNGTDPVFLLGTGMETRKTVEKRNAYGQPLESRVILSETKNLFRPTAYFYETKSSLPVATVENSMLDDAAVLTAENGNVSGLATHDWEGRWTKADAGYSSIQTHTGRYSIKVVDAQGPTTSIVLKGVNTQGYGYIVSAWIYCEANYAPTLSVGRFRAGSTTALSTTSIQAPVGEAFAVGKWQRYEIQLTNAQLKGAENLFSNSNIADYLKISVGMGNSAENTGRICYVDDITCRPSNSTLALTAYDLNGRAISSTNNSNLTSIVEYDLFGNPSGNRDDKFRTFSSQATHFPGEND